MNIVRGRQFMNERKYVHTRELVEREREDGEYYIQAIWGVQRVLIIFM